MKIGERDREILRVSYEQQMVSIDQMTRYLFGGHDTHARRRLRELAQAGLLREAEVRGRFPLKLYRPTGYGVKVAQGLTPLVSPQRRAFSLLTLEHDLLVTEVRLRLAQFWDAVWLPERALRADEYRQIPDGVLLFQSGKKIAIELENSSKAKRRYQRIWQKWPGTGTFLVLYVATTPVVAALLRKLLVDAPKGAAFGLVEWEALQAGSKSTPKIWTPKGEVDLLSRRSF
jgi:hypothetical protein